MRKACRITKGIERRNILLTDIGLIVGVYAFIRLGALIDRKDAGLTVKIFAALGMLVVVVCVADILLQGLRQVGNSLPPGLPR